MVGVEDTGLAAVLVVARYEREMGEGRVPFVKGAKTTLTAGALFSRLVGHFVEIL